MDTPPDRLERPDAGTRAPAATPARPPGPRGFALWIALALVAVAGLLAWIDAKRDLAGMRADVAGRLTATDQATAQFKARDAAIAGELREMQA